MGRIKRYNRRSRLQVSERVGRGEERGERFALRLCGKKTRAPLVRLSVHRSPDGRPRVSVQAVEDTVRLGVSGVEVRPDYSGEEQPDTSHRGRAGQQPPVR